MYFSVLMKFAIVDIETTGGNAARDRITEIAIFLHDGEKVVDEFCSLINPECSIPPFISRLTGINDEMVANAPKFYEVAKEIVQITDGAVFVAHNANFDYNFIRESYRSLGFNFTRDHLCTVGLSRKIIPGFRSYSLGNLCNSLNISITDRHRAKGDAFATVKLFEILLQKNNDHTFSNFIKNDYINLRFPPGFNKSIIDKLPETYGVYYLHNSDGRIVYIGKSNNIRQRILSHFRNKQSRKAQELRNSVADITFEETGNELIALLLESEEIKKNQPIFNRAQKRTVKNHSIYFSENENGYITFRISNETNQENLVTLASTYDHALDMIDELIHKFKLCQKLCGVFSIVHACFKYSVKQCNGACIGKETPEDYNKRAKAAIDSLQYKSPNFMIIDNGRSINEKSVVHIENGKYVGFGYYETEFNNSDPETLKDFIKYKQDNKDINRIIRNYLSKSKKSNLLLY
jgi:DNA polymerase-3 subunit epsilon